MIRRKFAAALCLCAASFLRSGQTEQALAQVNTDEIAIHGMLVIGSENRTEDGSIYAHHLPMFVVPHRFQGLWKVTFGKDADRLFQQHRKRPASKDTIYTLFPRERFALRELVESRKAFQADLYQGHFERGGKVLIRDVTVRLIQTVHWHEFDPAATRPDAARYIVFGEAEEPYLAHEITIAPNYDQILRVIALPPERFPEGATVVLPKRDDWAGIHEGNRISSVIEQRSDSAERVSRLKVLSEYYLEEGELSFTRLSK